MSCVHHNEVMVLKFVQKMGIENKKLGVQLFRFKREKKEFTSIWSNYINL